MLCNGAAQFRLTALAFPVVIEASPFSLQPSAFHTNESLEARCSMLFVSHKLQCFKHTDPVHSFDSITPASQPIIASSKNTMAK